MYRISPDGSAITCTYCGLTSRNKNDVSQRYCANCKKFHEDEPTPFSVCTHCGNDEFLRGPSGGACVNITCIECGARSNVTPWPGLPMTLIDHLPHASPLELEAIRSSKRNQET